MSVGTWREISGKVGVKGGKGCGGRAEKQTEQRELIVTSWRTAARGRRGGVRSSPMAISSVARISIFWILKFIRAIVLLLFFIFLNKFDKMSLTLIHYLLQ